MNLLVINVLSSLVLTTLIILSNTSLEYLATNTQICTITNFSTVLIFCLSELAPLLIAGDHYLAILFPLRYNHIMTRIR